jgi:hypothetical protein
MYPVSGTPSVDELTDRLDAAVAGCSFDHEVHTRLALTDDEKSGPLGRLGMAFEYAAAHEKTAVGSHFIPMLVTAEWCYPPPLDQVDAGHTSLWLEAADRAQSALARARLNDICWEGGFGPDRGESGRRAADAYLEHAEALAPYDDDQSADSFVPMARFEALKRAARIAGQLSDGERLARICEAANGAVRESLASSNHEPGVALGLIETLVEARYNDAAIDGLLSAARERHASDRFIVADVLQLELTRASTTELEVALQRELILNALAQADQAEGLVRMHHLEHAVTMARDFGQPDLVKELTARLQALGDEDLGLVAQSVTTEISRQAVEEYLSRFTNATGWREAFLRLIQSPPSGNVAENREHELELARSAPLTRLLPRVLVGGDGLPRFTASTEEERREAALVNSEMLRASISSMLLAQAIERIWEKWGPIPENDLAAFLGERGHVKESTARGLARDFGRYFAGDFEGCAFCITPRLESLVRALVLAIPLPVYRTQRAATPGQYPGLGRLIPELQQAGLDESWSRFLQGFLAKPMGTNYRNELSHGFEDDPSAPAATLLLISALYLTRGVALTPAADAMGDAEPDA